MSDPVRANQGGDQIKVHNAIATIVDLYAGLLRGQAMECQILRGRVAELERALSELRRQQVAPSEKT